MTTTTEKRNYKPFPYKEVLTYLLAGNSYDETAKKFGYFEADKADSTKSFRAHLHRARNTGFKHEGKVVKFPAFTREGKPVFGKGRPNLFIASLIGDKTKTEVAKPAFVTKTKIVTDETNTNIKLVDSKTRGRRPKNSVIMAIDTTGKFITLSVPKVQSVVSIDEFLKAISPLFTMDNPKVETDVQMAEHIDSAEDVSPVNVIEENNLILLMANE